MSAKVKSLLHRATSLVTPSSSRNASVGLDHFESTPQDKLFPKTNPLTDGDECLHDCDSCTINYPNKFDVQMSDDLYGNVSGWETHLIVATGRTDWVRDVTDEKGSVMEAVEKSSVKPAHGPLKLSASNMPLPDAHHNAADAQDAPTRVLLLPAMIYVDNVTPRRVPVMMSKFVNKSPSNTTRLALSPRSPPTPPPETGDLHGLVSWPCPHRYLVLLCSQKTRDARCGQSAPLLRREFERHLRPLDLYRDLHDERPGGVGIYFISHVGGHKYSANVIIYRQAGSAGAEIHADQHREDDNPEEQNSGNPNREAAQCIWLARVKPADCENIVRYTILQGKVVKPESQLRGGFDRTRGLTSW